MITEVKITHYALVSFTLIFLTGLFYQNRGYLFGLEGFQKSKEKRPFYFTFEKGNTVMMMVARGQKRPGTKKLNFLALDFSQDL